MKYKKALSIFLLIFSLVISIGVFSLRDYFKDATSLGRLGIFLINLASSPTFFVSGPAFLTVIAGGAVYPLFWSRFPRRWEPQQGIWFRFFLDILEEAYRLKNLRKNSGLWFWKDFFKNTAISFFLFWLLFPIHFLTV